MTLKSDSKFEEKLTCGLENNMKNLANFHQSTWKSHNWDFAGILFVQSWKFMSWKYIGELCVMTMKNYAKIEEEFTCQLKIDKFWSKHSKISNICTLIGCLWPKYEYFS